VAQGAAALAHLVACGGDTKRSFLRGGGVGVLLRCVGVLAELEAGDADDRYDRYDGAAAATAQLCVQCFRLMGNLCYGWGDTVQAIKAAVGGEGAGAVVRVLQQRGCYGSPL
jgi:hypothetical protein